MLKKLYLSSQEGHFMRMVMLRVDRAFQIFDLAVQRGALSYDEYKPTFEAWEKFIEDHMRFLQTIPENYATDHTRKTADKKQALTLKELRTHGKCFEIELHSGLGSKLFQAVISTEMVFKILNNHFASGDITIDKYHQSLRLFESQKQLLNESVVNLAMVAQKVKTKVGTPTN